MITEILHIPGPFNFTANYVVKSTPHMVLRANGTISLYINVQKSPGDLFNPNTDVAERYAVLATGDYWILDRDTKNLVCTTSASVTIMRSADVLSRHRKLLRAGEANVIKVIPGSTDD